MSLPEATLEHFRGRVRHLAEQFARHAGRYRGPAYNEETARSEFISPLFEALGWDIANRQGHALQYREVVHEEALKVGDATKAPDYTFRIGGQRKFFVEAKKPGVDLKHSESPAYQLRRYAWSAKLPLSILTDFDELAVYDTRVRPNEGDKASVARVFYFSHSEYAERSEEIWNVFSKEAVLKGSFDAYAEDKKGKRGTSEVDAEFLKEIEGWREELAKNIALRNADLSIDELNYAVQATIDRILFLRIAEGRGAEVYGRLMGLVNGSAIYSRMMALFREADDRYNSGIFDFKADRLTPNLAIDDKVLKPILSALYYPQSPYEFSVLPAEILGNVYEQFLGKVIRLTPSGRAKVEEKPEVKKAGGVYYTPSYIVDYIVAHTVGKLVEGKSPKEMETLRVVDPACGSGSFLLAAYQKLLDAHLAWYRNHEPRKHKDAVFEGPGGDWRLTTAKKREILLNSIYGVDIDRQAVEVTKLSLLLKCLEGETNESLRQLNLYGERALPSLEKNIQCGNSLISPAGLLSHTGGLFPPEEDLRRLNPFDWKRAFPHVFKGGGFDAVIGNPPYVRIQAMKEWAPLEASLFREQYKSASSGNFDIYVVFLELGLRLLSAEGQAGFIVPHKFFNAKYGEPLRSLLAAGQHLASIVHFGDQQVFLGVTTYTSLVFFQKSPVPQVDVTRVERLSEWRAGRRGQGAGTFPNRLLGPGEWNFVVGRSGEVLEKLKRFGSRLGDSVHTYVGLQTSADDVFVLRVLSAHRDMIHLESRYLGGKEVKIERGILHPLLKGGEIGRYFTAPPQYAVLFPYRKAGDERVTPIELSTIKSAYPSAYQYLLECRRRLLERSKCDSNNWWLYPYPKNLSLFGRPKILCQVLGLRGSFSIDMNGSYFFVGGGTAGGYALRVPGDDPSKMRRLLGVLNSRLVTYLVSKTASGFRGGYFVFAKSSLDPLPLPSALLAGADDARLNDLDQLVSEALALHSRLAETRNPHDSTHLSRAVVSLEGEIDRLVYNLYELTREEIAVVERG